MTVKRLFRKGGVGEGEERGGEEERVWYSWLHNLKLVGALSPVNHIRAKNKPRFIS